MSICLKMQSLLILTTKTKSSTIWKHINSKNIWGYVAIAFNRVDADRLKLVGPDRLCAEWVLKNGGAVALTATPGKFLKDYNVLPPDNIKILIKEVDATNSSIMKIGLEHFKNCNHIDTVILDTCNHLEVDSLEGIIHLRNSLKFLQISNCGNFKSTTFEPLKFLKNLVKLKIANFCQVELSQVRKELKVHLPNCEIVGK